MWIRAGCWKSFPCVSVREDIVKMVADIPVAVRLKGYSASELQLNTRDEILSAMVVYGFLSYHDGYVKIPNREIKERFQDARDRIVQSAENVTNC